VVHDVVLGDVTFQNDQLDDMVLLAQRRHADLHAGGGWSTITIWA